MGSTTGRTRHRTRLATAGVLAAALLLTGCSGDGGSDKGGRTGKEPSPTTGTSDSPGSGPGQVKAAVLTADRVTAVMPREGDLPGWGGPTGAPVTIDLRTEDSLPVSCVKRKDPICPGALFASTAMFAHPEAGTITISVYAYDKDSAAMAASVPMLDRYAAANLLPSDTVSSRLPGVVGESSRAKRGRTKLRSQGAVVVSRVGTSLLIVETGGLNAKIYTGEELVSLGKVIADRSRQAQHGETPSAKLAEGALDYRKLRTS
ncbi:hypothetical protein ACWDR0_22465 [Streptomyces sp. NPDC003691]